MKNEIVKGNILWADKDKTKAIFKHSKKGKYSLIKSPKNEPISFRLEKILNRLAYIIWVAFWLSVCLFLLYEVIHCILELNAINKIKR